MYEIIDLFFDLSPFIVTFLLFGFLFFRELEIVRQQRERIRIDRMLTKK